MTYLTLIIPFELSSQPL